MLFKKKNKYTHQLMVGLRTQLCKECQDFRTRLCEVDGKPALFHQWIADEKALLKINSFLPPEDVERMTRRFRDEDIIPPGCFVEMVRQTFALVEYPDGSVGKVKPELVTFLDKGV